MMLWDIQNYCFNFAGETTIWPYERFQDSKIFYSSADDNSIELQDETMERPRFRYPIPSIYGIYYNGLGNEAEEYFW